MCVFVSVCVCQQKGESGESVLLSLSDDIFCKFVKEN